MIVDVGNLQIIHLSYFEGLYSQDDILSFQQREYSENSVVLLMISVEITLVFLS